jgi:hypothetical protein
MLRPVLVVSLTLLLLVSFSAWSRSASETAIARLRVRATARVGGHPDSFRLESFELRREAFIERIYY